MSKPILSALFVLVILFTMTGCGEIAEHVAIPVKLPLLFGTGFETNEYALTLDSAGAVHIARTECLDGTEQDCRIVYEKYVSGGQVEVLWLVYGSGQSVFAPDIAITDSGQPYIVYRVASGSPTVYTDWWWMPSTKTCAPIDAAYQNQSAGKPMVAAYGNTVYAVHEVISGTGSALRYKKIAGSPAAGGWASTHPADSYHRRVKGLAVDDDLILHVVYVIPQVESMSILYNNNGDGNGDMTNLVNIRTAQVSNPALALGTSGGNPVVFIAYTEAPLIKIDSSTKLKLAYCTNSPNCTFTTYTYDMQDADNWRTCDAPAMDTFEDTAYIAFAGYNDNEGGGVCQVYQAEYDIAAGATQPVQVTHSLAENRKPRIAAIPLSLTVYKVFAWYRENPPGYDLYLHDTYHGQFDPLLKNIDYTQQIELQHRNGHIAGIGNGLQGAAKVGWWQTYLSYNDYPVFVPFIRR